MDPRELLMVSKEDRRKLSAVNRPSRSLALLTDGGGDVVAVPVRDEFETEGNPPNGRKSASWYLPASPAVLNMTRLKLKLGFMVVVLVVVIMGCNVVVTFKPLASLVDVPLAASSP